VKRRNKQQKGRYKEKGNRRKWKETDNLYYLLLLFKWVLFIVFVKMQFWLLSNVITLDTHGYTRVVCNTFWATSRPVLDGNPYIAEEYLGCGDFIMSTFYCTWGIWLQSSLPSASDSTGHELGCWTGNWIITVGIEFYNYENMSFDHVPE
jgi:hypothetical protein